MVKSCSAVNCTLRANVAAINEGVSFHRFPKDEEIKKKWVLSCRRLKIGSKIQSWVPGSNSYLCSKHFLPSDYLKHCKFRKLRPTAIPTVFNKQKQVDKSDRSIRYTDSYAQLPVLEYLPNEASRVAEDTSRKKLEKCRNELHNTSRREKRLRKTVESLKDDLSKMKLLNEELEEKLECYKDIPIDFFKKHKSEYSPAMRNFCLTMSLYSRKGYNFLRKTIPLPHFRTIQRWLRGVDGKPGFSEQSLKFLKECREGDNAWQYRNCAVTIDAMKIKKLLEYDANKGSYIGQINLGENHSDTSDDMATEVLVFMAVGIVGHWKQPIAYFLINGVTAEVQKELVLHGIDLLSEAGIQVRTLTLDGHRSNISMFKKLGCCLQAKNIRSDFCTPDGRKIYCFLDVCHALKLVRNNFAKLGGIVIPGMGIARWSHITALNDLQQRQGLNAGNKLSKRHINFYQQKMKVALAAQTLSASVATALQFAKSLGDPLFSDSLPTIHFIRTIDRLFDVLNSRTPFGKGFKKPLDRKNFFEISGFLHQAEEFLLSLTLPNGDVLVSALQATGFIGFVMSLRSFISVGKELLFLDETPIKFILAYKFSQDHVELFFNFVRGTLGWNNNPTAKQFGFIFRRFLVHVGVHSDSSGNCVNFSAETDLECPDIFEHYGECNPNSVFVDNIVAYIAGFVVRKLIKHSKCSECNISLITDSTDVHSTDRYFLSLKNNGGLILPSNDVISLLKLTESRFKTLPLFKRTHNFVASNVLFDMIGSPNFTSEHFSDSDHRISLMRSLIVAYCSIRSFHETRIYNKSKSNFIRPRLTKQIHFMSQ